MARVEEVMVAFIERRKRKVGAHRTDGRTYWLHDNPIIRKDCRTFIIDTCGWPTPTTLNVLNQITNVSGDKLFRPGGGHAYYEGLRVCGKPWDGTIRLLQLGEVKFSPSLRRLL